MVDTGKSRNTFIGMSIFVQEEFLNQVLESRDTSKCWQCNVFGYQCTKSMQKDWKVYDSRMLLNSKYSQSQEKWQ